MIVTLLQKRGRARPRDFQLALESTLSALKGRLSVSHAFVGFSEGEWARIELHGPDSEIMQEIISRHLGIAKTHLSEIELHGNYRGIVTRESRDALEVDIGVEIPRPIRARVGLSSLRTQLCDGKPTPLGEIAEDYCLCASSKVLTRVTELDPELGKIEASLSDSQLELFSDWISCRLDRVQVFHSTRVEVERAIDEASLRRDIASVESQTLTTHSLLCKLGTDAVGLIPRLGSVLRSSELKPFIPRRIAARYRPW